MTIVTTPLHVFSVMAIYPFLFFLAFPYLVVTRSYSYSFFSYSPSTLSAGIHTVLFLSSFLFFFLPRFLR